MRKAFNCLLLALLIQVVASCGNLNGGGPSEVCSDSFTNTLTITTGTPAVAGSIMPAMLDRSSLTYYFAIDNLISKQKSLQTFTSASDSSNYNFPIELESGYYTIGVYALDSGAVASLAGKEFPTEYNAGDLKDKCVLWGCATVDLRQDETVSITLSANGLSQNGLVLLKFYTNGWTLDTAKFNAECGIKNKAGQWMGPVDPVSLNAVTNAPPASGTPATYRAEIPAGTYTFIVNYTNKANASAVYTWTEDIIVLANQTLEKTIALADIIDYAPVAPTDFKASYRDFDSGSAWCYVNFAWTDNANNERGYQIDLKALWPSEDDALITSDMAASWEAFSQDPSAVTGSFTSGGYATITAPTTQAFDNDGAGGSGIRKDGSLLKNSESATFKLSRGYRYLARISAVGNYKADNSGYCYVSFTAGGTGKADYSDFAADARYIKVGD